MENEKTVSRLVLSDIRKLTECAKVKFLMNVIDENGNWIKINKTETLT